MSNSLPRGREGETRESFVTSVLLAGPGLPAPLRPRRKWRGRHKSETFGPPEVQGPSECGTPRPVGWFSFVRGAKGFATAGVLALRPKIPIRAIVGTGTGALLAALYAQEPKVSKFEWNLMRVKPGQFVLKSDAGINGAATTGKSAEDLLEKLFGMRSF